jgi:hypothetical protein
MHCARFALFINSSKDEFFKESIIVEFSVYLYPRVARPPMAHAHVPVAIGIASARRRRASV